MIFADAVFLKHLCNDWYPYLTGILMSFFADEIMWSKWERIYFVFFSVGNLVINWLFRENTEAFESVEINTDKKLVIAGGASHTNDYLEKIKRIAKDDDRIIMTGFVQGQELEELYSNCYLYCLPSDIEGMPLSLLEAMSYGKTCLISDIEENTQVSGKYAYSFKKGNIEDLKNKLEELIVKDKTLFDSDEVQNYILGRYNWDDVQSKTELLYKGE